MNEHRIMVAAMGGSYEQLLRLEVGDSGTGENNRYFSMTGTIYSCRTKEVLMDGAEESLQEQWESDLANSTVVAHKLNNANFTPEWTDDEKLEWLGDVEEWVTAPDWVEWGIEHSSGGQCCDRWELLIPHRVPTPLHPNATHDGRLKPDDDIKVLWLIEPNLYGSLIDLWNTHHLKRSGDEGYIQTPQWVKDLAANSPTLEQAFLRWWWTLHFPEEYADDAQSYTDVIEDLLLNYKAQEGIKAPWSVVETALKAYVDEQHYPFDVIGDAHENQPAEDAFWQGLEWWFDWGWGKVQVEEI